MLVRDDERWVGRGREEDEALDDAIHQACPSHVARELLAREMREDLAVASAGGVITLVEPAIDDLPNDMKPAKGEGVAAPDASARCPRRSKNEYP